MRRRTVVFLCCLIAAAFFSGCVSRANYKILSFFFDGVPNPAKAVKAAETAGAGKGAGKMAERRRGSKHGPFASGHCEACHRREAGNALVLPLGKLCFKCHDLGYEKMKWVHGPVAAGGCWICHNPHMSGFPYLLDAPPEEVCFRCHEKKSIIKNKAHHGVTWVCTTCHNPHGSNKRYFLK